MTMSMDAIGFALSDGGRAHAGFRGEAPGDCVARAIAIAADLPYREVYDELALRCSFLGRARSARDGVPRKVYDPYLADLGWAWTPTMQVGKGCTVHLRRDELPSGRLICRLSRHLCAVIDGVVYDTHDPSRAGTRCVYGYWTPSEGR